MLRRSGLRYDQDLPVDPVLTAARRAAPHDAARPPAQPPIAALISGATIRAYYTERRAISKDYLELTQLVLAEQGDRLPERDRGMFELSATLHRARLQQIDRDEADALARRSMRDTAAR